MKNGWQYYKGALISSLPPHELPDIEVLNDKKFWNAWTPRPYFARWISEFDCSYETNWWNMIKDSPFEIDNLKKKRRYEIRKGDRNFDVLVCDYEERKNELFQVYLDSKAGLPKHLKKGMNIDSFETLFKPNDIIFVGISKRDNKVKGFAVFRRNGLCIAFITLKTSVNEEKRNINFSIIHAALKYFSEDLSNGYYIDDGSRPINHTTTNFQEFLQKYFGFRKAYSVLNIRYRKSFSILINILFPIRNFFLLSKREFSKSVYAILLQEEIRRSMIKKK